MKRILFLDDNKNRCSAFHKKHTQREDRSIYLAYNYYDAAALFLIYNEWFIISLDYDLGEDDIMCLPGVNNKHKTGSDVAQYMVDNDIKTDIIILHTYNPVGASNMRRILETKYDKIYYVPFGQEYPILNSR